MRPKRLLTREAVTHAFDSPFTALRSILLRKNNALVIFTSGLIFASQFQLSYVASLTFAAAPYRYSPLVIGFVLLASGLGNVLGSIFGGRYSDIVLRRMTKENGGVREPEASRLAALLALMPDVFADADTFGVYRHALRPAVVRRIRLDGRRARLDCRPDHCPRALLSFHLQNGS